MTRAVRFIVLGLFVLGIILIVISAGVMKGDGLMDSANDKTFASTAIPLIDEATPVRTETATFALG